MLGQVGDTDESLKVTGYAIIVKSRDFKKKYDSMSTRIVVDSRAAVRFRGTNSVETNLGDTDGIFIEGSCKICKMLLLSIRKGYVQHILAARSGTNTY